MLQQSEELPSLYVAIVCHNECGQLKPLDSAFIQLVWRSYEKILSLLEIKTFFEVALASFAT